MPRRFAPCADSAVGRPISLDPTSGIGCRWVFPPSTRCCLTEDWSEARSSNGCPPWPGVERRSWRCKGCARPWNSNRCGSSSIRPASSMRPPLKAGASRWSRCCCSDLPPKRMPCGPSNSVCAVRRSVSPGFRRTVCPIAWSSAGRSPPRWEAASACCFDRRKRLGGRRGPMFAGGSNRDRC